MPRNTRTTDQASSRNDDGDLAVPELAELPDEPAGDDDATVIEATIMSDSTRPGTDVAVQDGHPADVEGYVPSDHPAMVALNTWLAERFSVMNDSDIAVAEIVAQVLSADSVDEVLADHQAVGMRDLMNIPMTIHSAKPHQSSYEKGSPYFFYCDVTRLDTGERIGVTAGAQTVIAQIVRMYMLGAVPFDAMPVLATKKPTVKGYWPYRLGFPKQLHKVEGK